MQKLLVALITLLPATPTFGQSPDGDNNQPGRLFDWHQGIGVQSPLQEDMRVYLWFYEWNMFEARTKGQHTRGAYNWKRTVSDDGATATIDAGDMKLTARAVHDGAELTLKITNATDHAWPEIAGIIPCFNPGTPAGVRRLRNRRPEAPRNEEFVNTNTWYVGHSGFEKLVARQIHFNDRLRAQVDGEAQDGQYVFSQKWPTSPDNATQGLIVRESTSGGWVAGIAWEEFLSSQGHNPWSCMHLSVNVGPLKPGESKTIRGRMYLFPGTRDECLKRFRTEF